MILKKGFMICCVKTWRQINAVVSAYKVFEHYIYFNFATGEIRPANVIITYGESERDENLFLKFQTFNLNLWYDAISPM